MLPKMTEQEEEQLHFIDALEVDLSLAAGHKHARGGVVQEEEEEGDDEGEDSSTSVDGGSSLVYVEGVAGPDALRRVASRAVLVHAAYEVDHI